MLRNKPALDSPRRLLMSSFPPLSCSAHYSPLRAAASFPWISPKSEFLMEMLFACAARPPFSLSKLSLKAPGDPGPDNSEHFRGHSLSVTDV